MLVGSKVTLNTKNNKKYYEDKTFYNKWNGLECEVVSYRENISFRPARPEYYLHAIDGRPDTVNNTNFWWPASDVELISLFNVGDIVEITGNQHRKWDTQFNGFQAEVISLTKGGDPYLKPLSNRPDGFGTANFYWYKNSLKVIPKVVPVPDYLEIILDITDCITNGDSWRLTQLLKEWSVIVDIYNDWLEKN